MPCDLVVAYVLGEACGREEESNLVGLVQEACVLEEGSTQEVAFIQEACVLGEGSSLEEASVEGILEEAFVKGSLEEAFIRDSLVKEDTQPEEDTLEVGIAEDILVEVDLASFIFVSDNYIKQS